ncbi:MAG: tRNA (N6-isopentenyl adenosine(37)-C2)-methylthiotransferase MiaB [Chloroflexota bacterium]
MLYSTSDHFERGESMGKFHVWTIGCQMNTSDARRLTEDLHEEGLQETSTRSDADLVVIYSCMVRQHAEDKVRGQLAELRRLKQERPSTRVAVAGCVGEVDAWQKQYPFVDFFLAPGQDLSIRDRLNDLVELDQFYRIEPQDARRVPRVSEGVTIHQGCNRNCTFCIVPSTRGRERSRTPEDILAEVRGLTARGTKEVILLSQIVERYGRDLRPRVSLAELLARLDAEVPGLERIRFLTSYPADFHRDLIEAIAALRTVCEDVNLPLQSGDDEVLRAMRRGYTVDLYRDLVHRLRERVPDLGMSTDIIVGFPGETERQFENTLSVLEEIRFDVVHVAAYSVRPGTPAAEMEDQLPLGEKKRRLQAVETLQRGISAERHAALVGRTVEVLVEGEAKGKWYGRTRTNRLIHVESPEDLGGQLVDVHVTSAGDWSARGDLAVPVSA